MMVASERSEFVITRTFDAPRELVFDAWTNPEHLNHWWGPASMKVVTNKFELRPGGTHLYSMQSGETTWWGRWIFREVEPPARLVFISSFSDENGGVTRAPFKSDFPLEVLSTVTFEEHDGRTTLTMRGVPLNANEAEQKTFEDLFASMQHGWGATLDQLAGHLSEAVREIRTTRVFDAPRELVWKAWTDPKHIAQWWGPNGFTTTTSEMNVEPGGVWQFVMHGPDGRDWDNRIVYREVVKPERLVYDHGPAPKFAVTVTLEEENGKTRLSMRSLFETRELRDGVVKAYGAVEGMHQTLSRLERHLPTMEAA